MLIITRKKNESVIINENIEIMIIEVQGEKIRLGIDAPHSVKIIRKELLETEVLNKEAAKLPVSSDIGKIKDIFKNLKK